MPSMVDLAWLIPVAPFVAFVVIVLGAHRSPGVSQYTATAGIALALVLSLGLFWAVVRAPEAREIALVPWFEVGDEQVDIGIYVDPTDAVMVVMVAVVCLLIFVYSIGYMEADARAGPFFAYISLFAGSMLGAIVCDNLLAFFVFWELMGVCSYLLIGFWWEKEGVPSAALKAFLVTKTADLFLLLGLVLLHAQVGSLSYATLFSPETVQRLAARPYIGGASVATVAALLLFGGTIGKSAQVPLHGWLPDAMVGPTPVSALIHAATMVSAGVYLMIRAFPLLIVSEAMPVVAIVGTITALGASVLAVAQHDIKRVLAFSTISQLGFMVAAVGIGAYAAATFHLVTHAFFKALLFLAAGSVIHGIERGHHHTHGHAVRTEERALGFSPNNMWKMGGLAFRMPLTALTFLIGSLALSGFPLISAGFWSKDEILTYAWSLNPFVFWGLAVAAGFTAFYAARQISLVFLGTPRTRAAVYARESPLVMTAPLVVLALFVVGIAWVGIPEHFPVLGHLVPGWFGPFVEASVPESIAALAALLPLTLEVGPPLVLSVLLSLGGLFGGWWIYGRRAVAGDEAADPIQQALGRIGFGWLYTAAEHRFYVDRVYSALAVRPAIWLARAFDTVDRQGIDAAVVAFGRGFGGTRSRLPSAAHHIDVLLVDRLVDAAGLFSLAASRVAVSLDDGFLDNVVRAFGFLGRALSGLSGLFDVGFIDRIVGAIGETFNALGRWARRMQTGLLPDYLWNAFMIILLLVAALVLFQRT